MIYDLKYTNDITLFGENQSVSGMDLLQQRLRVKFAWFYGEYIYAPTYGIPYFTKILNQKETSIDDIISIITDKIYEEIAVTSVVLSDISYDTETNKLSMNFNISSIYGDIVAPFNTF